MSPGANTAAVPAIFALLIDVFVAVAEITFPAHSLSPGYACHSFIDLFSHKGLDFGFHCFIDPGRCGLVKLGNCLARLLVGFFQCVQSPGQHLDLIAQCPDLIVTDFSKSCRAKQECGQYEYDCLLFHAMVSIKCIRITGKASFTSALDGESISYL